MKVELINEITRETTVAKFDAVPRSGSKMQLADGKLYHVKNVTYRESALGRPSFECVIVPLRQAILRHAPREFMLFDPGLIEGMRVRQTLPQVWERPIDLLTVKDDVDALVVFCAEIPFYYRGPWLAHEFVTALLSAAGVKNL